MTAAHMVVDHTQGCDLAGIALVRRGGRVHAVASAEVVAAVGDVLQFVWRWPDQLSTAAARLTP